MTRLLVPTLYVGTRSGGDGAGFMNDHVSTDVSSAPVAPVTLSPCHLVTLSPCHPVTSSWRAWCFLAGLSFRRQARAHLLVWIAVVLLAFSAFVVGLGTQDGKWVGEGGFRNFSGWVVVGMFCGFLLPLWSLSFATEALGREREARNLVWVLTRPLSRPAIYLAKLAAALPWVLGFNLGGFALLCAVGWPAGGEAFALYWPAVAFGSVAYAALFHLMGAWFRRAAVVAVVYAFFMESFLGRMPGYWKRVTVSFYTKCMVFSSGADHGVQPIKPENFIAVDGATAGWVLAVASLLFLAWGLFVFSRSEYLDLN